MVMVSDRVLEEMQYNTKDGGDGVSNNQYNTKDVVVEMVSDRVSTIRRKWRSDRVSNNQYNTKDGEVSDRVSNNQYNSGSGDGLRQGL